MGLSGRWEWVGWDSGHFYFYIFSVPPSAMVTPTSLTINAGSTANFTCTATGNPTPQIRWLTGASVDVTTLGDARIDVCLIKPADSHLDNVMMSDSCR